MLRLDLHRGVAALADREVPVATDGAHGELRVGGPHGPLLRPAAFGERSRAVALAAAADDAEAALAASVLALARVEAGREGPGGVEPAIQRVLALVLAGARESGPPLDETVLMVARATGWSPDQLYAMEAAEVDRLARHLDRRERDGWNRLLFAEPAADALTRLERDLAANLLRRLESGAATASADRAAEPPADNRFTGVDRTAHNPAAKLPDTSTGHPDTSTGAG